MSVASSVARRVPIAGVEMGRWGRPVALGLTAMLLGLAAYELSIVVPRMADGSFGVDINQYLGHTARWLDGGSLYLDRQLHGRYAINGGDSLYPPTILYLTVPFALGVPFLLWWIIPLGILSLVIIHHRPSAWTWPLIAGLLAYPRTWEMVLYGNPAMWVAAALGAATIAGWASILVLLKPSLFPFALVGIRGRWWWVALGCLALASLPFGPMWLQWLQVVRDSQGSLLYSVQDVTLILIPVVVYIGRGRRVPAGSRVTRPPSRLQPLSLTAVPVGAAPVPIRVQGRLEPDMHRLGRPIEIAVAGGSDVLGSERDREPMSAEVWPG